MTKETPPSFDGFEAAVVRMQLFNAAALGEERHLSSLPDKDLISVAHSNGVPVRSYEKRSLTAEDRTTLISSIIIAQLT